MNQQHDKIILPPNYLSMSAPDLVKLRGQMEARIRQIDEQIKDAARYNPAMAPGRFGSVDWHSRDRRAQDYYRRDIARIHDHLHNLPGAERGNISTRQADAKATAAATSRREAKINAAFRRLARQRLTEVLYEGILQDATEEAEA